VPVECLLESGQFPAPVLCHLHCLRSSLPASRPGEVLISLRDHCAHALNRFHGRHEHAALARVIMGRTDLAQLYGVSVKHLRGCTKVCQHGMLTSWE